MIFMIEYFIFKLDSSNSEKSAKIRRKQQTYTHVVTRHFPVVERKEPIWYARHDVTGSDLHHLPPYYSLAVPYLKVPNMRTDTWIWNSCDASASERGKFDHLLS